MSQCPGVRTNFENTKSSSDSNCVSQDVQQSIEKAVCQLRTLRPMLICKERLLVIHIELWCSK